MTPELQPILDFIDKYFFVTLISAVLFLVFNAFFGYKIFKFAIIIESSVGLGFLFYAFVGPFFVKTVPESVNVYAIFGIVGAIVGILLAVFLLKLMLFINGAALGAISCLSFFFLFTFDSAILSSTWFAITVSVISAILIGLLFVFLFKPIYILITSVGGMTLAGFILSALICPAILVILSIIFSAVGFILGIAAAVYQFRRNSKYSFY